MKTSIQLFLTCMALFVLLLGCNTSKEDSEIIALIKPEIDSVNESSFNTFRLGTLFDYHLELPQANKSWVTLWVEGYNKGKEVEASPLITLSYGHSPNKTTEGAMGLGIMEGPNHKKQLFLYAPGVGAGLIEIDEIFNDTGATMRGKTTGDKLTKLKSGEVKTLAIWTLSKTMSMQTFDMTDEEQLHNTTQTDESVLLLKIKVEYSE